MKKFVFTAFGLLIFMTLLLNYQGYDFEFPPLTPTSLEVHPYSELEGYDDILALQRAFVRNARRLKPSVVSINNLREIRRASRPPSRPDSGPAWLFWFRGWLNRTLNLHYQMESLGSGILYTTGGYILTNAHVVEETEKILVKLSGGEEYTAKLVGVDPKTDLAVIKIFSFTGFPRAPRGRSEGLQVGQWVMAIGNPYGLEGTVTVGVISGIRRSDLGIATFENFIQTDASINPGNSGGPLINLDGEVIGINTAIAEIGAGVGFAIPIDMAVSVADQLIENGEVERGWLGVGIQGLTPELADSFNIPPNQRGVVINNVQTGTPADKGGLRRGDIIVGFDGRRVPNIKTLQQMVADTQVGKEVPIHILRDGQKQTIQVIVGKFVS